jgi:hypothetical protein
MQTNEKVFHIQTLDFPMVKKPPWKKNDVSKSSCAGGKEIYLNY